MTGASNFCALQGGGVQLCSLSQSNLPQTHTNARVAQTCRVAAGFFDESTERVCQQLE